jgi:hypothetical protein
MIQKMIRGALVGLLLLAGVGAAQAQQITGGGGVTLPAILSAIQAGTGATGTVGTTGLAGASPNLVGSNGPTLVAPALGAATGTSLALSAGLSTGLSSVVLSGNSGIINLNDGNAQTSGIIIHGPGNEGTICNFDVHTWVIGWGTNGACSQPPTAAITWTDNGNVTISSPLSLAKGLSFSGSAPAVSACGGGTPAVDGNATNFSGTVTFGSAASSCTVTFANGGFTTFNHCQVTFQSSLAAEAYTYSKTVLTITATALSGSADYRCDGI